jgi:DNA-binding response OmpR family regulator
MSDTPTEVNDAATNMPTRSSAARPRVLLVEDNFLLALNLASVISGEGYQVIGPAPSVDRAMHDAQTHRPQAAVLDIRIVGGTSVQVATMLRARNVPLLFISAYDPWNWLPADFGAIRHLSKPVDADELRRELRAMLNHRKEASSEANGCASD